MVFAGCIRADACGHAKEEEAANAGSRPSKILLPLLSFFASDGRNHTVDEAVEAIATEFKLSPRDREEQVRSGPKRLEKNVAWALYSALPGMGVLERRGKGVFRITRLGICFWRFDRVFPVGGGQKRIVLIDKPFVGR